MEFPHGSQQSHYPDNFAPCSVKNSRQRARLLLAQLPRSARRRRLLDDQTRDRAEQPVQHQRNDENPNKMKRVGKRQIQPVIDGTRHDFYERRSITLEEVRESVVPCGGGLRGRKGGWPWNRNENF